MLEGGEAEPPGGLHRHEWGGNAPAFASPGLHGAPSGRGQALRSAGAAPHAAGMHDPAPLILTLLLDAPTQAHLEAQRRRHFPPERNHIPAHVSLFHHLPGEELAAVRLRLAGLVGQLRLPVRVAGLRSLGRGVAYRLESPGLMALRGALARDWAAWLTAQDRQGFSPHVTVQNKVPPAQAAALLAALQAGFVPMEAQGVGVALWWYRGGPWELVETVGFR